MGNYLSNSIFSYSSRKRKRQESKDEEAEDHEIIQTKKWLKLELNNKCVINELGEPDVILVGFDRHWPCHKSVLSQSDFFKVFFNSTFLESSLSEISLHSDDCLITEKSFEKLLDVMYNREIDLQQDEVFHLIVTAQYFQMNNVVDFCEKKIMEMIRSSNCIDIYHFADRYFFERLKRFVFKWMLLRLFPVKCWDQLTYLSIELAEELIKHPRLVVPNEMYLYHVLKILIQIQINGTCAEENEKFYGEIRNNVLPFLLRKEGKKFTAAFDNLRLANCVVRSENIKLLIRDNILPRSIIEACVFTNWMSLILIESPDNNLGPSSELVKDFEKHAMRLSKIIDKPDYHSFKFNGFSFGVDLAIFFDGRTLIVKRVHSINEHKISHSHLLRRIMIRWSITELNSLDIRTHQQEEIQNLTMTTNEEVCLKQLHKEPQYPCRISFEILFHVPYKSPPDTHEIIDRVEVSNTSMLKSNSIPSEAFQSYKRFFS